MKDLLRGLLVVAVVPVVLAACFLGLDALGGEVPKFPLPFVQNYSNDLGNDVAWVLGFSLLLGTAWLIGHFTRK